MAETERKKKKSSRPGPSCSICTHERGKQINKDLWNEVPFRKLVELYGVSMGSLSRHTTNCLKLTIKTIVDQNKVKRVVNVYEEFAEQLDFAKQLRLAAQAYLSDAADPLRLSITPKAHEIEVTYFDHNDMETIGFGDNAIERPKKKVAQLSIILEAIYADGQLEPDKFKITAVDIRKFALDAINTADTCIDKFARIGGDYTKDKVNPADAQSTTDAIAAAWVELGFYDEATAKEKAVEWVNNKPETVSHANN